MTPPRICRDARCQLSPFHASPAVPPLSAAGEGLSSPEGGVLILTHEKLGVALGLLRQLLLAHAASGGREGTGGDSGSHGCGWIIGLLGVGRAMDRCGKMGQYVVEVRFGMDVSRFRWSSTYLAGL